MLAPPPTPRLNSLPASFDDALWGRSPESVELLGHLRSVLAAKNAAIQALSGVPVIHTAQVMAYFGFQRRHFRKASFKYVLGWPGFSIEDGEVLRGPPLRLAPPCSGLHLIPAFPAAHPVPKPVPAARRRCSPRPHFGATSSETATTARRAGGACPARTWSFVKSPSSLEEKEALDEAVAYERWMEEGAVDALLIAKRKRRRSGEADRGGAKLLKRTRGSVSEQSSPQDTPTPLLDNHPISATSRPGSSNLVSTWDRPVNLHFSATDKGAESTVHDSDTPTTPTTPATVSSDLLGPYPSVPSVSPSTSSPAFSPSAIPDPDQASQQAPRYREQVTAAHHLLLAEYENQRARLALIPTLESRIAQLEEERAVPFPLPDLSTLRNAQQDAQSAEQLCQVELTVLRASQAARDERIASLESLTSELEHRARVAEQRAAEAEKRAVVLEERLRGELERRCVAEDEVAQMRILLERDEENEENGGDGEDGENGEDELVLIRKRLAETQARLVKEQQTRKALEVEVGRLKALADR